MIRHIVETAEGRIGDFSFVPPTESPENAPITKRESVRKEDLTPARNGVSDSAQSLLEGNRGE